MANDPKKDVCPYCGHAKDQHKNANVLRTNIKLPKEKGGKERFPYSFRNCKAKYD